MSTDIDKALAMLSAEYSVIPAQTAQAIIAKNLPPEDAVNELLELVQYGSLLPILAKELNLEYVNFSSRDLAYRVEQDVLDLCDIDQLASHTALPMVDAEGNIVVAMANPNDVTIRDYLTRIYGPTPTLLADAAQIQAELLGYNTPDLVRELASQGSQIAHVAMPTVVEERSVMMEYVDSIFFQALAQGASDVHLEFTQDGHGLLRYRIDGILIIQAPPPRDREQEVIGTILTKSALDAANLLEPQDGTFSMSMAGRRVDVRVSMLPQANGPSIVCRLLDSAAVQQRLDDMGFYPPQLKVMRAAAEQSQGAVFVCGPTGSGKTTTLYGMLREVNAKEKRVMTIEDPIEYRLPFIGQTQIRSNMGERSLTFGKALRALMRQDPDVILVGECRDGETAHVAAEAAITGHLVLSTVHAPSACGVYTRLIEMGVPSYTVAEAISVTIFQRLIRRVHDCSIMDKPTEEEAAILERVGLEVPMQVPRITGCMTCRSTGYRGRVAAVEVLKPSPRVRSLVAERAQLQDLVATAKDEGFKDIITDGYRHLTDGVTTVEEIARVLETSE